MLRFYLTLLSSFFLLLELNEAKTANDLFVDELLYNIAIENSSSHIINFENNGNINNSLNKVLLPDGLTTKHGLVFEKEFQFRWENNSYTDIMQLIGLSNKAQALQFKLLINKAIDDSIILIFESLEKGNDIIDSSWVLDYNVIRGQISPEGVSADEINVLIYNLNQNNGLLPGDYNQLLKLNYNVIDLPDIKDSVKSSIMISNTLGSTFQGDPIDITPSRDELKIFARVPVVYPDHGIIFQKDTAYQLEDDTYIEIMQLKDLDAKLQAMQFKLLVNKADDDNNILTFVNIQKGADLNDPSWVLDYNVLRGPLTANGGSEDQINVLIYNLNQNNGLPPGDFDELLKVKYRVADLPALQDSIKSSIHISETLGSTYQGYPINITPSRDDLIVIAKNRVGLYGDVNGDGCIDVLDLIMVVDHIIGRDSLDVHEFERADIAPWIPGNSAPYPDGLVNVLDLAVLQEIILSGEYPDGTVINDCIFISLDKSNSLSNPSVKFYITEEGITAYLNSNVDIIGVQIELGNISDNAGNIVLETDLGQGYYMQVNDLLNVLLYDRQGNKVFHSGENLLVNMPFHISNPEDISIKKLILIDTNRNKLVDNEVEIINSAPPSLPIDYKLFQNYPNPFNPKTTIQYSIPEKCQVSIKVYDLLGSEIVTLIDEEKLPGKHELNWNASIDEGSLTSGVYFYRLQAGSYFETKKMMLLK